MMSVLLEVLQEEMNRLIRHQEACEADLLELPKGYISRKNIRGRQSYYLQYREGGKIISKWVSTDQLQDLEEKIQRRKHLEETLRCIKEDRKRLNRALR